MIIFDEPVDVHHGVAHAFWLPDDAEGAPSESGELAVEVSVELRGTSLAIETFEECYGATVPQAGWHRARCCARTGTGWHAARRPEPPALPERDEGSYAGGVRPLVG